METSPLLNKVLRFISIRPRSEKEVKEYIKTKLYKEKLDEDKIISVTSPIISNLRNLALLDDESFAKSWAEWRLASLHPKGLRIIKMELSQKGVSKEIIELVLEKQEYKDMEVGAAKRVVAKQFKKVGGDPFKIKNYLYSRGFTSSSIESAID